MNAIHRILLVTDGSVTAIIEAVAQKEVTVETVLQEILYANEEIARRLGINEGEEVNHRIVYLKAGGKIYAKAISYAAIKRLQNSFREDLMRADIPIGKIMRKHKIEARREIRWSKIMQDILLAEELGVKKPLFIVRNYKVIHRNEILIDITEFFPIERFEDCV
ncbi:MAG: chorismate pyruvate-lyase family protein [Archaeoglobaceae archaeon]|nr:chorismate pyruvate-lyase family protein [Archaeoglobaceae archaeon]MDW7990174.1 chorismate pyruvate-lyase family protein [Archaeoglobaceae archaeon]